LKEIQTHAQVELIPGPMDLLNLSWQYTMVSLIKSQD